MMRYPVHTIIHSVIELWESNTSQANYLFLQDDMKTKRPDMHLAAPPAQHMLFVQISSTSIIQVLVNIFTAIVLGA